MNARTLKLTVYVRMELASTPKEALFVNVMKVIVFRLLISPAKVNLFNICSL